MDKVDFVRLAEDAGFDMNLIENSLALTPEKRIEEHQKALDLVWELEKASRASHEESQ